jgi:3-oxoacyl-[acyl-carrier-protein] synthase II
LSSIRDDAVEAEAIHDVLPGVPVTAPKSFFGNLGAGGGAVELVASVMAVGSGKVPPTRNYVHPDPKCPVAVIRDAPREVKLPTALSINFTGIGQATALVLGEPG